MASEQPEVEAAAGVVEEIRDLSELSSLEEQQSQLVQLVQGFTENQENLGSVYKQVQNALRGAGATQQAQLALRSAMHRNHDVAQTVSVINRAYDAIEAKKASEVRDDESRQISGEVLQGGAQVDVLAPTATEAQRRTRTEAFNMIKTDVDKFWDHEINNPEVTHTYADETSTGKKIDKWKSWNGWVSTLMTDRGLPPPDDVRIQDVKPFTKQNVLDYIREKVIGAKRSPRTPQSQSQTLSARAQKTHNILRNMMSNIANKIFVKGTEKKGYSVSVSKEIPESGRRANRIYKDDLPQIRKVYDELRQREEAFTSNKYADTAAEFIASLGSSSDQRDSLGRMGVAPQTLSDIAELLKTSATAQEAYHPGKVSSRKAQSVFPSFLRRFDKLVSKIPESDKDAFAQALSGWFDLATGERGINEKKYVKKYGQDALRLLARHVVRAPGQDPDRFFEMATPTVLVDAIKNSKKMDTLVQNAKGTNPASILRLHNGASAARAVLENPSGSSPPKEQSPEADFEDLTVYGLAEPVARGKPAAAEAELVGPEQKKGAPAQAAPRVNNNFSFSQWRKTPPNTVLTEAQGMSVLNSIRLDTKRWSGKFGKPISDMNRAAGVIEYITGTGGRANRQRKLAGPLHEDNARNYPHMDRNGNINSLLHSISREYRLPGTRDQTAAKNRTQNFHQKSLVDRSNYIKALLQKRKVPIPRIWNEHVEQGDKRISQDVNKLYGKIVQAPLNYMELLQQHSNAIYDLDKRIYESNTGNKWMQEAKGKKKQGRPKKGQKDNSHNAKLYHLLPVAAKALLDMSQKYDKHKGLSDKRIKNAYELAAEMTGRVARTIHGSPPPAFTMTTSMQSLSRSRSPSTYDAPDEKAAEPEPTRRRSRSRSRSGRRRRSRSRTRSASMPPMAFGGLAPPPVVPAMPVAPAAPAPVPPPLPAVVLEQQHPHNRHTRRTHLSVHPTANVWKSTGYRRSIGGDMIPPETGRVHLVRAGDLADPMEHFMRGMEPTADSNMGRKKSGPFKNVQGDSLVMSKSRFTSVRKRNDALEITLRRGVTPAEIDNVVARLTSHRLAVHSTWVFLMVGSKKHNLGKLASVDFEKLRRKLASLLLKHRSVGLHLVDEGVFGPMHRHNAHTYDSMRVSSSL